jgi:hypothetical protein
MMRSAGIFSWLPGHASAQLLGNVCSMSHDAKRKYSKIKIADCFDYTI